MPVSRLRNFVLEFTRQINQFEDERAILDAARPLMKNLVVSDDWLPKEYAVSNRGAYQQYLLYCDPFERFSLVSFVWGPGQMTPIHDHGVWGLIGMLRGSEISTNFRWSPLAGSLEQDGDVVQLYHGDVEAVSPALGDIHKVRNASTTESAISIHLYGANIGAITRNTYDISGEKRSFVSGYTNAHMPNIWIN